MAGVDAEIPSGGDVADSNNVYGYSATQTMTHVLKAAGENLTRENVMKQAASIHELTLPMALPGIVLSTSATDFAPIKQTQLMKFNGETWQLFCEVLSGSGT
jgi:branched-chain amino acid transport system substrate-binding protein